jgi:hypothetical protein
MSAGRPGGGGHKSRAFGSVGSIQIVSFAIAIWRDVQVLTPAGWRAASRPQAQAGRADAHFSRERELRYGV